MTEKERKPEWTPKGSGSEFAAKVVTGVDGGHDGIAVHQAERNSSYRPVRRKTFTVEEMAAGVLAKDRTIIGRSITLLESNNIEHVQKAQALLKLLLPHTGNSIRVGITGTPGVGKSTLIEAIGLKILERGYNLAVLAIDPSSNVTGGSILGDKTRMEKLSTAPNAFIRPSPSGGNLGGVARKTRETMLLCEAAGYDFILVETVGVGQSEVTVRHMVDFFLLLMMPGAGDELQGIKRGIMELADAVLVNKADVDKLRAEVTKSDYERALHYMPPSTPTWQSIARTCSAYTGEGLNEILDEIEGFASQMRANGIFANRRKEQSLGWLEDMINEKLRYHFFHNGEIIKALPKIKQAVISGELPTTAAVYKLFDIYDNSRI